MRRALTSRHGVALAQHGSSVRHASSRAEPLSRSIGDKEMQKLTRLANRVVKAADEGRRDPMWSHTPDRGQRLSRELAASVKNPRANSRSVPGMRASRDTDSAADGRDAPPDLFVPPVLSPGSLGLSNMRAGYLIQCQRGGFTEVGVILGFQQKERDLSVVFLSAIGSLAVQRLTDISFAFPDFIPKTLAAKAGLQDAAENVTQTDARIAILRQLRKLLAAVGRATVDITQRGDLLYNKFRNQDPERWGRMTLEDSLRFVFGQNVTLRIHHAIAMKQYLQENPKHFIIDGTSMLQSRVYFLRPAANIANHAKVTEWVDSRSPVLTDFVAKAAKIIEQSHQLSQLPGPSSVPTPVPIDITFDSNDLEIIRFLRAAMLRQRFVQGDPYAGFVPSILKLMPGYEEKTSWDVSSQEHVFNFLKELGVYTPWDTLIKYGADGTEMNRRGLDVAEPGTSTREIEAEARSQELLQLSAPVDGSPGFVLHDGLDSIRHDFGQLPVYVIDEASAHELDDGISVERIPDSEDVWVHVHVADPTSLIHPRDILARGAERLGLTMYFAERVWPMIPSSLVQQRFSLGAAESQPVMTFSTRIAADGTMAEVQVRVGTIRNTKVVSYDSVDKALEAPIQAPEEPLSPNPLSLPDIPTLSDEAVSDLKLLREVYIKVRDKRYEDPSIAAWQQPSPNVIIKDADNLPSSNPDTRAPVLYQGFPEARLYVTAPVFESLARRMVGECMIMAGSAAATFARSLAGSSDKNSAIDELGLPLVYRVSPRSTATDEDLEVLKASRHPASKDIDQLIPFKRHIIFGSSSYTARPGVHAAMGNITYARTTSPLRRFTDMVNHWQIKAYLRSTIPPSVSASSGFDKSISPMFTRNMLELLAAEHTHVERMNNRSSKANLKTWVCTVISRIMELPPSAQNGYTPEEIEFARGVLGNLDAVIMGTPVQDQDTRKYYHDVYIPKLALTAELQDFEGNYAGEIGDPITVRIVKCRMKMMPRVFVAPAAKK